MNVLLWSEPLSSSTLYSKPCVKRPLSKRPQTGFQDLLSLNTGQRYCRMLRSILQYFWPSLSYHLSLRSLFCLFLSGRFTQVLLYVACASSEYSAGEPEPCNKHQSLTNYINLLMIRVVRTRVLFTPHVDANNANVEWITLCTERTLRYNLGFNPSI